MKRLVISAAGLALVLAQGQGAWAASQNIVDQACRAAKIRDCTQALGQPISPPTAWLDWSSFYPGPKTKPVPTEAQAEAALKCAAWADTFCVVTVDVPTAVEVQAAMAENSKQQREQWAAWLKALQDTGVVKVGPSQP